MRDNLAPTGLLLFDVNELHVYRTFYAETSVLEQNGKQFTWRGLAPADVAAGSICESRLEVAGGGEGGDGVARGETAVHRQRHFPESEVRATLQRAGLECLDVYGHGLDGVPKQPLDIEHHTKAVYIARRASA